jgi:hypothetical protein
VTADDLLANGHAGRAVVGDLALPPRQRLSGDQARQRGLRARIGIGLRIGLAVIGPAEATHGHLPALIAMLEPGLGPVLRNDHGDRRTSGRRDGKDWGLEDGLAATTARCSRVISFLDTTERWMNVQRRPAGNQRQVPPDSTLTPITFLIVAAEPPGRDRAKGPITLRNRAMDRVYCEDRHGMRGHIRAILSGYPVSPWLGDG